MSRLVAPQHLATMHLVLSALILIWNISAAGRTAQLRTTPRPMAFLSALAGLLLLPALTVLLVSNSSLSGRALFSIAWLWPTTVALVAAQAIYAVARGVAAPAVGVPIAVYDALLVLLYAARYEVFRGASVGVPLLALVAAHRDAVAFSAQPLALLVPWYLYLPIFAPPRTGRRGVGTVLRVCVAALAVVWGALILVYLPAGARAVRSYARYVDDRLQERPDSDFTIGLKIFPVVTSAPASLALRSDLALADSIGAGALSIYVTPEGATNAVLDSVAHSVEDSRAGRRLIAALDLSHARAVPPGARDAYLRARVTDIQRIVRRLQPDLLVPVVDPNGAAARALGPISLEQWTTYLRAAASAARRADSAVRVVAHVGGFGARDSVLYAWATSPDSPVDAVALSLFPGLGGADAMDARMQRADAWLRAARSDAPMKEHWVLEAGGFPMAHGDASQARALWGALAWATSRSAVKGLIVYEASDYTAPLGLRAAGGRLRVAATTVRTAITALREGGG